jgi:hypothetical protein
MSAKNNPGRFDCYANALADEPMFVLLARDPDFYRLVMEWVKRRGADIRCGERPETDWPMVNEAQDCAAAGEKWRRENKGKWRLK